MIFQKILLLVVVFVANSAGTCVCPPGSTATCANAQHAVCYGRLLQLFDSDVMRTFPQGTAVAMEMVERVQSQWTGLAIVAKVCFLTLLAEYVWASINVIFCSLIGQVAQKNSLIKRSMTKKKRFSL